MAIDRSIDGLMERFDHAQGRLKSAGKELGELYVKILELRRKSDPTPEDIKELDLDMHDIIGAHAHILNTLRFAKRDIEKYRIYRVIGRTENGNIVFHYDFADDLEGAKTAFNEYKSMPGLTMTIESKLDSPWEVAENV